MNGHASVSGAAADLRPEVHRVPRTRRYLLRGEEVDRTTAVEYVRQYVLNNPVHPFLRSAEGIRLLMIELGK